MISTKKVPESYLAYCRDETVTAAVDHLLAEINPKKKPSGLAVGRWDDLPALHQATLSAHQVRQEYAIFLFELWDEVWKPALKRTDLGGSLEPLAVADSHGRWGCDAATVWDKWMFVRGFNLAQEPFGIGTRADFSSARLWIDPSPSLGTLRLGGAEWLDPDGHGVTSVGVRWSDDGLFDLNGLHEAADAALAAIGDQKASLGTASD